MKKIVGIFSIVLVLCLMAIPAMAESINAGVDFTYTDNGDGTYDVAVVVTADSANVAYGFGSVSFDPTVWSAADYVGVAYDLSQISNGKIALNEQSGVNKAYAKGDVVFGFTATCLDEAKMSTSPITLSGDAMFCDDTTNNVLYMGNDTAWDLIIEAAPAKTPAAVEAGTAAFQTITGASGQVYNNVWVNKYTAKANDDTITAVKLAFNGKTVTVSDVEIEAGGTVEFDVAIVGAALEAEVTPSVTVK